MNLFKLKKVELLGFKSFADRTRLEFEGGTAAVVGPNGCGKSNLADAISWVLGEQSARMLRGERMADVIFSGTSSRPPTGMAEVSLTLIDPEYAECPPEAPEAEPAEESLFAPESEEGAASAAPTNGDGRPAPAPRHRAGEIMVTRRLFRSGESEYLINGELSRLRDIQDLFMGTGLGPESYAIIEQGRIGQILSSKPSDRRAIIEEAAGVSKFKTRKRLAEAKLESARANLARITDILEEVTKQVNSLKRQASKARRYRELQGEIRGRLQRVLTSRLRVLDAECRGLRATLEDLQASCTASAARLESLDGEYKSASARHEELEARLTEAREALAQSELECQRQESRIEQARQQVEGLQARSAEAAGEAAALEARRTELDAQGVELARRREELQGELSAARQAAESLGTQKNEWAAQVAGSEVGLETARQALLDAVGQAAELRNQLVQVQENRLALERQGARLEAECAAAGEESRRLEQELEAFLAAQTRGETALTELRRAVDDNDRELGEARQSETALESRLDALRQESSAAQARREALEESLARHAYTTESVRQLLSSEYSGNGHGFRPLGLLADFVEVSPGYEELVEEFMKQDLDCVVVERHEEARSAIALLRSQGTGRSTFFVTRVPSNGHSSNGHDSPVRRAPGVEASMRDLVRFEARLGLNGDLVLPALDNAFLVTDAAAAETLAGQYPECHFLTSDGQHYHHRLVSGGKGSSAGPLALRRDFRELERRSGTLRDELAALETQLAAHTERVNRLEQESTRLGSEKVEAEKRAVVSSEKLRQVRESSSTARERLEVASREAGQVAEERRNAETREADLHGRLAAAALDHTAREEEITRCGNLLREHRAQLEALSGELAQAQTRASALEERTAAHEAECQRAAQQQAEVGERLARLAEQTEGWRVDLERLAQESEASRLRLEELRESQQNTRAALRLLEEESQTLRSRREELAPSIDAARAELDAEREKRSEAEVALARSEADHAHHVQQCRDELNLDAAQLLAEPQPEDALAGDELLAAEEELRGLKTRLENLGPVNMMALEELQESEERFTFLETQRQDLLASIEDTAQAIREIDQVSRLQFMEAFKAINEYFAESFKTLFGGGVGQMRLSDENDPESGLDLAAQPPGKRLQNVLLLSGGEKALTALALLIAVFRYTPSPFCILDEVDAPLDESNVDRFTRMIRDMSRHTQFILITHNKRTMEIAKLLYGVTMQEAGVSKLVSVRFDEVDSVETEAVAVPA